MKGDNNIVCWGTTSAGILLCLMMMKMIHGVAVSSAFVALPNNPIIIKTKKPARIRRAPFFSNCKHLGATKDNEQEEETTLFINGSLSSFEEQPPNSPSTSKTMSTTLSEEEIIISSLYSSSSSSSSLTSPKRKNNFRMQLFAKLSLPIMEIISAGAVLLSSLLVALDTLDNLSPVAEAAITDALLGLNLLFALDFFLRWYAAGQFKGIYLTKPLVVIDIIVILIPLFLDVVLPLLDAAGLLSPDGGAFFYGLQNSAGLQNLLLLRVLRIRRVLTDIGTFRRFAGALGLRSKDVRPYQLQLARVILTIFTLLSVSSGLIYTTEHNVNPNIPDYFTALYFGLTTLTTVGFGDITPVTAQGRLVVSCSIIAGVAIIPAQAAKLVDVLIELQREQKPDPLAATVAKRRRTTVGRKAGANKDVRQHQMDGNGPGGIPIDDPIMEWNADGQRNDKTPIDALMTCGTCQAAHHWSDAVFCWSCGSQLAPEEKSKQ